MELALIPIAAMAGTLLLSPPLLRWANAEDGVLPNGNGTSRAWPCSCVAALALGYVAFFLVVMNVLYVLGFVSVAMFFLVIVNVLYVLGFAKVATLFLVIVNVLRVPGFEGKVV